VKKIDIAKELARLKELEAELLAQESGKTTAERMTELAAAQPMVKPGTPEMETLLAAGYGLTVAEAERVIAERDKDPQRWPMEDYKKAKAFLEAYHATPQVISTRRPWRRSIQA